MVHAYDLPDLVIPNATSPSNSVSAASHFRYAKTLSVTAPSTLTGTITIQASQDDASTFGALQSGGGDITITVNETVIITDLGFTDFRVNSGSSEGAERTFKFRAVEETR